MVVVLPAPLWLFNTKQGQVRCSHSVVATWMAYPNKHNKLPSCTVKLRLSSARIPVRWQTKSASWLCTIEEVRK